LPTKRYTVTAALPYSNGRLHVGHIAGCYLPADIFVRYLRSRRREVAFICGSDDYGVPVALTARKEGKSPREVAEYYRQAHKEDFDGLGIAFDIYSGTTTPIHTETSQHFFLKSLEHGHLVKRADQQLYDAKERIFLPDRYVEGACYHCGASGARGDQCEACGRTIDAPRLQNPRSVISGATPELRETVHWYFQLTVFRERLRQWIEGQTEWRQMVRNFSLGLLNSNLPERAITRDLEWGIPVPLPDDPDARNKVLYVWFDAPIGYVSFTAEWCQRQTGRAQDYERWWKDPDCEILHFIGEDNVIFHAIMWPAMLMSEGSFQLPANVVANCFLNIQFPGKGEEKMSTSRGTAVWINEYLKAYEPDPLRYYLTMVAPEQQRTAFNFDDLVRRNNEELAAALGNFVHRTVTFTHRYLDGIVPARGSLTSQDRQQVDMMQELPGQVACSLDAHRFKSALEHIMAAARRTNRYFDHRAPWSKRKEDMDDCRTIMNVSLNTIKTLGVVCEPFLPFAAGKIHAMLAMTDGERHWDQALAPLPEGRPLGEAQILFRRIEVSAE